MPNGKAFKAGDKYDTVPNTRYSMLWWVHYRRRLAKWERIWRDFGWLK